jgi:hypothetical protein
MRPRVTHPFDAEYVIWARTERCDIRIAGTNGDMVLMMARGDTEFVSGNRRVIWDGPSIARAGDHIAISGCRYRRSR